MTAYDKNVHITMAQVDEAVTFLNRELGKTSAKYHPGWKKDIVEATGCALSDVSKTVKGKSVRQDIRQAIWKKYQELCGKNVMN